MWRPPERIKYQPAPKAWPDKEEAKKAYLFKSLQFQNLHLKSRCWVPAMVPWRATEDGFVSQNVIDWYKRFAKGKPGAIVIEATGIRDIPSGPLLRISHQRYLEKLRELTDAVKEASEGETAIYIQLIDFLTIKRRPRRETFFKRYFALSDELRRRPAFSSKSDREILDYLSLCSLEELNEFLSKEENEQLRFGYRESVNDIHLPHISNLPQTLPPLFAAAARRARDAGFDGIELHYAHAYTMASFLSPTNQRSDGYGQTLKNRLRLPLEVYDAVRHTVGKDYVVGCRYLADEIIDGGGRCNDAIEYGLAFSQAGLDFLSLSRGGKFDDAKQPKVGHTAYPYTGQSGYECMPQFISDKKGPFGRNINSTASIRAAIRAAGYKTPIVVAGGIYDFQTAETLLQNGQADIIAAARQSLADPDWFLKMKEGRGADIRICRYSNYCEALDQNHKEVTCELWDRLNLEEKGVALSKDGRRRLLAP